MKSGYGKAVLLKMPVKSKGSGYLKRFHDFKTQTIHKAYIPIALENGNWGQVKSSLHFVDLVFWQRNLKKHKDVDALPNFKVISQ